MLVACDGDGATTSDARLRCAETADPHDEDGDRIFDACDNCPTIVNPTQADLSEIEARAFADGVGDSCDPRPSVGGDDLRAFYSFASEAQADAWTGSGFTISGDALHATGAAMWTSKRAVAGDGVFVLAHVESVAFGAQGELAITLDGDGVGVGATCTLSAQQLTATEVGAASSSSMLASSIGAQAPVIVVAWRSVVVTPTGRAGTLLCRVVHAGVAKEARLMLTDDLAIGSQVIEVSDAAVDITSLSVYTSPPPKQPER